MVFIFSAITKIAIEAVAIVLIIAIIIFIANGANVIAIKERYAFYKF